MLKITSAHVSWISASDLVMSSKVILRLQKGNELIERVGERTLSPWGLTYMERQAGGSRQRETSMQENPSL